jgi:hypothetical protein
MCARNIYFSQNNKPEQDLVEDLVIEALKIYSQDVYYIPRALVSRDAILNEAIESQFTDANLIEMYIENVDGFDGDGTLFSKFGLEIREQATFVVSRKRWHEVVGVWDATPNSDRPNEGDLIYLPLTKSLFEVKWVETKSPFFQLSKVPVWKMTCELFEYGNEEIKTGIEDIDTIQLDQATEYIVSIDVGNGTDFAIGERVTQVLAPATVSTAAMEIYGSVTKFDAANKLLTIGLVKTNTGKFNKFTVTSGSTDKLVGTTSGASWSITKVWDIDDTTDRTFQTNSQQAQNHSFEQEGNANLVFDEMNPFGEPNQT